MRPHCSILDNLFSVAQTKLPLSMFKMTYSTGQTEITLMADIEQRWATGSWV